MLVIPETSSGLRKLRVVAAALGIVLLPACSDDSGSGSVTAIDPKLSVIEQKILQRSCTFSSCHGGDTPKQGLDLTGSTYQVLVDQPSTEVPTRILVVPSDPDASYLLEKIASDQPASGSRMPYSSSPLPDSEISVVRQWIEQGAPDD